MTGTEPIRPEAAPDAVAFVGMLRQLKEQSGHTFRQLEKVAARHGDYLPRSTTADVLRRQALPRADVLAAFVRACAGEEHVTAWLRARERLAGAAASIDATGTGPLPTTVDGPTRPPRTLRADRAPRRFPPLPALLALMLVAGVGTTLFADDVRLSSERGSGDKTRPPSPASTPSAGRSGQLPATGWYQIRPAHIPDQSLCLGEGRERNRRTDRPLGVQRPCSDVAPDTFLFATTLTGVYEIQWHHPVQGVGCLSVDDAQLEASTLLQPITCEGAPHQRFLLEPVDQPRPGGYRLRPMHTGLCLGALYGVADVNPGAEVSQSDCSGQGDQEFLLHPVKQAFRSTVLPAGGR